MLGGALHTERYVAQATRIIAKTWWVVPGVYASRDWLDTYLASYQASAGTQ